MRIRLPLFLCAMFALQACVSIDRDVSQPISKTEFRSLPSSVATGRVLDLLADILISTPAGKSGARPVNPLQDIWYWTIPRASHSPGICQTDRVIFWFADPTADSANADTPVRVEGISAAPRFHILFRADGATEADRRSLEERCRLIRPEDVHWIEADDDGTIHRGAWTFDLMKQQALSPRVRLTVDCPLNLPNCREEFFALALENVWRIQRCDAKPDYALASCTRFSAGAYQIKVYAASTGEFHNVFEINVTYPLVLWHERID